MNGVCWLMNDQEGKVCSFTNVNPTANAQWVVVEVINIDFGEGIIKKDAVLANRQRRETANTGLVGAAYVLHYALEPPVEIGGVCDVNSITP